MQIRHTFSGSPSRINKICTRYYVGSVVCPGIETSAIHGIPPPPLGGGGGNGKGWHATERTSMFHQQQRNRHSKKPRERCKRQQCIQPLMGGKGGGGGNGIFRQMIEPSRPFYDREGKRRGEKLYWRIERL